MTKAVDFSLPERMRFIDHGAGGAADCMVVNTAPVPVPGPQDLLVRVAHAGVNRPDVLQRSGLYPPPADASPFLGLEISGHVVAIGGEVVGWKIGDSVCALAPGGAYAEYCVVPADQTLPVPAGMGLDAAAALPETWFTVWANLIDLARLKPGERLLVHGGASGIGLTAIQLAQHLGVECVVTVGSDEKLDFCKKFGAKHAINYRQEDFADAIKSVTNGQGVDVVLDIVGEPYFQRNLKVLRRDGRLVSIAFLCGSKGNFDLMPVMMKRLTITGSTMRSRSLAERHAIRNALETHIWPQLGSGKFMPHIHARFPLARATNAHLLMESNQHIGKIVLDVFAAGT